jgi:hypothetical protein
MPVGDFAEIREAGSGKGLHEVVMPQTDVVSLRRIGSHPVSPICGTRSVADNGGETRRAVTVENQEQPSHQVESIED